MQGLHETKLGSRWTYASTRATVSDSSILCSDNYKMWSFETFEPWVPSFEVCEKFSFIYQTVKFRHLACIAWDQSWAITIMAAMQYMHEWQQSVSRRFKNLPFFLFLSLGFGSKYMKLRHLTTNWLTGEQFACLSDGSDSISGLNQANASQWKYPVRKWIWKSCARLIKLLMIGIVQLDTDNWFHKRLPGCWLLNHFILLVWLLCGCSLAPSLLFLNGSGSFSSYHEVQLKLENYTLFLYRKYLFRN